ncbi:MAG: LysM peptidoglycan-binding domain-containing protein [Gammaproteobacteria bacterium]
MNKSTVLKVAGAIVLAGVLAGCAHKKAPPPQPSAATEQALANAEQCISQAQQLGVSVDQAQQLLDQAKTAAKVPDDQKAQSLASQVCQQTDAATNAYYLKKARALDAQLRQRHDLNSDEQSQLQQGETQIANNQGKPAYDTLSALMSELQSAQSTYTVTRGDTLWGISGKSSIYGNPYEWPLIYMNNADKINNPDRIYPDQQLNIRSNPSQDSVDSATHYAKTRGPWKNGQAMSKDHAWLNAQQSKMNSMNNGSMNNGSGGGH